MPITTANGMSVFYEDDDFTDPWTQSEVILIQHGWGRSSRFFYHWVPALARTYRVLRRDLRGHGLSDDPPAASEWTVDDLVGDIIGFLDAIGVERVHYVGESAGGVLGAAFAAKAPDRLRSLTMMSSPLSDPTRGSESYGYGNLADTVSRLPIEELTEMLIKGRGLVPVSAGHEQWMRREWTKNRRESLAGLARLFPSLDLTPLLPSIRVPTLILAPANSATAPLPDQKVMHGLIPGARLEIIDGRGHELYFEQADACLAALKDFLRPISAR